MTDQEIINFLKHDAINKSYFAKKLYTAPNKSITNFHNKLNRRKGETFSEYEKKQLRRFIYDFANSPI